MKVGKREFELTNANKIYFPKSKITKGDLVKYYQKIAPWMLKQIKDYPLVMVRYPDGITKEGWYHKERPSYFPKWVTYDKVRLHSGKFQDYVMADEAADLAYLGDQGVIVIHSWLSKKENLTKPNKIIIDLDPPHDVDGFKYAKAAAKKVKNIFEREKLKPYLMATGQNGLHVVCPIKPEFEYAKVKDYVHSLADQLAAKYPDDLTTEVRKNKRKGRVFLDYLRNEYGQTAVAPYSVRAKEGAPIATPLAWSELASLQSAQKYNIKNIFSRLKKYRDPWKGFDKSARKLKIK